MINAWVFRLNKRATLIDSTSKGGSQETHLPSAVSSPPPRFSVCRPHADISCFVSLTSVTREMFRASDSSLMGSNSLKAVRHRALLLCIYYTFILVSAEQDRLTGCTSWLLVVVVFKWTIPPFFSSSSNAELKACAWFCASRHTETNVHRRLAWETMSHVKATSARRSVSHTDFTDAPTVYHTLS